MEIKLIEWEIVVLIYVTVTKKLGFVANVFSVGCIFAEMLKKPPLVNAVYNF